MGLRSKVNGCVPCGVERDRGGRRGARGRNALSEGPGHAQVWWLKQQEKDRGEGNPEPLSILRTSRMHVALKGPPSDPPPSTLREKLALLVLLERLVLEVPR